MYRKRSIYRNMNEWSMYKKIYIIYIWRETYIGSRWERQKHTEVGKSEPHCRGTEQRHPQRFSDVFLSLSDSPQGRWAAHRASEMSMSSRKQPRQPLWMPNLDPRATLGWTQMDNLRMNDIISSITRFPTKPCSIITPCLSRSTLLGAGRERSSPHLCSNSCYFGQSCSKVFLAYTTFLYHCSIIQLDSAILPSAGIPPIPYSEHPPVYVRVHVCACCMHACRCTRVHGGQRTALGVVPLVLG